MSSVSGFAGFWHVPLHVQRQVVGAREGPVAHLALEGLGARVLAVVPGEFVRPREPPLALGPVAPVRLLTWSKKKRKKTIRKKAIKLKRTNN